MTFQDKMETLDEHSNIFFSDETGIEFGSVCTMARDEINEKRQKYFWKTLLHTILSNPSLDSFNFDSPKHLIIGGHLWVHRSKNLYRIKLFKFICHFFFFVLIILELTFYLSRIYFIHLYIGNFIKSKLSYRYPSVIPI